MHIMDKNHIMASDRKHLIYRHLTYYVVLKVPSAIQHLVGKKQVVKTLGTRDLKQANRLKYGVIGTYKDEWDRLIKGLPPESPRGSLASLDLFIKEGLAKVKHGLMDQEDFSNEVHIVVDKYLDDQAKKLGRDKATGHPKLTSKDEESLNRVLDPMLRPNLLRLSKAINLYMDDMGRKGLRNATLEGKKKSNDFIKWLTDKDITKITVKDCNRYTREVIGTNGLSSKTNKDTVTELTVLFKWFMTEGYIPTNPFIGMRGKLVTNTREIWKEKGELLLKGN